MDTTRRHLTELAALSHQTEQAERERGHVEGVDGEVEEDRGEGAPGEQQADAEDDQVDAGVVAGLVALVEEAHDDDGAGDQ